MCQLLPQGPLLKYDLSSDLEQVTIIYSWNFLLVLLAKLFLTERKKSKAYPTWRLDHPHSGLDSVTGPHGASVLESS